MSFVWEFLGNVLFYVVGVFLFCTGEALRFAFTLGVASRGRRPILRS